MEEIKRLREQLAEVQEENRALELENRIFEAFFQRAQPNDDIPAEDELRGRARARKSKRGAKAVVTLTVDQKLEIASSELDEALKEASEAESKALEASDVVRAMIEEADLRLKDVRKEMYEFTRDVVAGAEDERTGKPQAERVLRWVEAKNKYKTTLVEKLRLKTTSLRSQRRKLQAQLKAKEEMGDVLHYIDFHQLKIENKQYMAKIEERNAQLLQLKLSTGRTVQTLNQLKSKLTELQSECERLRTDIRSRSELLERLRADTGHVAVEIRSAQTAAQRLEAAVEESSDLPGILNYVELKSLHFELARDVASWERKLEIAEMAARRAQAQLRGALRDAARPPTGPFYALAGWTAPGSASAGGASAEGFGSGGGGTAFGRSAATAASAASPIVRVLPGGRSMGGGSKAGMLLSGRLAAPGRPLPTMFPGAAAPSPAVPASGRR